MTDINEQRESVRKLEKSVSDKIRRIKRNQNIDLEDSAYDPRRESDKPDKYNSRQLEKYSEELKDFVNRRNQYVADANGRPVPRNVYREYKAQEKLYNEKVQSDFDRIKGLKLDADTTIGDSMIARHGLPGQKRINDPSVNAPYNPAVRSPDNFMSKVAMERMKDKYVQLNRASARQKSLQNAKDEVKQMADIIGKPEILESISKLSDKQFLTLWNFSGIATAVSIMYHFSQKLLDRELKAYEQKFADDSLEDFNRLVSAAEEWDDDSY